MALPSFLLLAAIEGWPGNCEQGYYMPVPHKETACTSERYRTNRHSHNNRF